MEENTNGIETPRNLLSTVEEWMVKMNLGNAVRKYKSVSRAQKRGHLTSFFAPISVRPFNNRANTSRRAGINSRYVTAQKRKDYEYAKRFAAKQSLQ